jgi:hypothetical protein
MADDTYSYVNKSPNGYSNRRRTLEVLMLMSLGFIIPFVLDGPQLLVGTLVNALLIRSALTLPVKRTLPIAFAPSAGAVMHGALFGPFSLFLIYFMPVIWAGNMILVYTFRTKFNYAIKLATGAIAKSGFLFAAAYLLYSANAVPALFLTAMGMTQIVTAALGGIIAYLFFKAEQI